MRANILKQFLNGNKTQDYAPKKGQEFHQGDSEADRSVGIDGAARKEIINLIQSKEGD